MLFFILRLLYCSSIFLQMASGDPRQKEVGRPLKVAESDVDVSDDCTVSFQLHAFVFLCVRERSNSVLKTRRGRTLCFLNPQAAKV